MSAKPQAPNKVKKSAVVMEPLMDPVANRNSRVKRMMWLLFAIAFLLFINTLAHGFVLDDVAVIEKNRFVRQGFSGIPDIFSTFYWEGYWESNAGLYRPLSLVMFAIEWAVSPENPFIHHFVNVLLYALSSAFLFRLLVRIFPAENLYIPFFITLIFAVHPIHSEVVANIKSRDEILCFLFFVLTFGYSVKTGLTGIKSKVIAAFLFLLCLLSKEAGILFLPVIGLWYLLFKKEKFLSTSVKLLPLVLVSGLWLLLHQYVITSSSAERISYSYHDNSLVACDGSSQIATGIAILGKYLLKTVLPLNMSYDYSYNQIPCETFGSSIVLITLFVIAGLIAVAIRLRKSHSEITFGILYFFITIILASNIFSLIGTTMGDRLLFAPLLGVSIVFVYGINFVFKAGLKLHRIAVVFFVSIAVLGFAGTVNRNRDWESNYTLFTSDVENAPNSARTHFNHGVALMEALPENIESQAGYLPEVIAAFEKSVEIDPGDPGPYVNLGVCYYRMQNYAKSIYNTRRAIAIKDDKTAYNNLADAYYKNNESDSAIVYYRKTIAAGLATATTYNFLGVVYFNRKDYASAIPVFNSGLQRFAGNEELLMNLGSSYGLSNRYKEAVDVFLKVVAANPGNKKAHYFLALTYQSLGDVGNTDKHLALSR